ncbi:hypothetical protein JQ607_01695 [Bradyrhizobium liaoningense]|uniref:hypothetical protein n=1 Tax=Bradyrhizobium liaoningense TaxID=43992 RepID=UPI001BA9F064|nr:hypothetical protein [Bradyrhizobium liaoningense]MBR0838897.1 hypothetical protein [Bradyrhizobium liaoningense]
MNALHLPGDLQTRAYGPRLQHDTWLDNGRASASPLKAEYAARCQILIVIAFPITVTRLLDKPVDVDLDKVAIEVPQIELPPLDFRDTKQ